MTDDEPKVKNMSEASSTMRAAILSTFDSIEDDGVKSSENSTENTTEDSTNDDDSAPDRVEVVEENEIELEITEENEDNQDEEKETIVFYELNDVNESGSFVPENPNSTSRSLPVKGSGEVDNILLISDSDSYRVTFIVDKNEILEYKRWSDIEAISQELPHIGAYEQNPDGYVLSISDYPYEEEVTLAIRPEDVTFSTIRVEIIADTVKGEN